jgi:GNAT superfamily N-acetyltransferase
LEEFPVYLANMTMNQKIKELLFQMHDEVNLFPYDDEEVNIFTTNMLSQNGGIIGVILKGDEIEGMVGLRLDRLWYSKEWFLSEMFVYVRPELRRSTRAKCLLKFAKTCAEEMNLPLLLGIQSNIRTEAKRKLYERQFDTMGLFFVHNKEAIGASHG